MWKDTETFSVAALQWGVNWDPCATFSYMVWSLGL
jgi:hypothetical protein